MNITLIFSIISLFYIVLLLVVYLNKKSVVSFENKIYDGMLGINLACLVTEILTVFFKEKALFLIQFLLIFMVMWMIVFTLNIYYISKCEEKTNKFKNKKTKIFLLLVFLFVILIEMSFPVQMNNDPGKQFAYGMGVNFVFMVDALCVLLCVFMFFKNKNKSNKKLIPLYVFFGCGTVILIIQAINPSLLLASSLMSYVTCVMYFTIENPDVKMIEEYNKNRDLASKVQEEKELLLYNISNDLKKPINQIDKACKMFEEIKLDDDSKHGINVIKYYNDEMRSTVNNILDITPIESSSIKIYDTKYNPKRLFDSIIKSKKNLINSDVKLSVNIDSTISDTLYGDSIRIKQILNTILDNSIKHTSKGFIEFKASEFIKNDISRLVITIEDSGSGIVSDELSNIYDNDFIETEKLDDSKETLAMARSIATVMGGTLIVNTVLGIGTKITFVLDQKIYKEDTKEKEKIEKITNDYLSKKKIIIAIEDEELRNKISKKITNIDADIKIVNVASIILDKIRKNEKYNLIIIDEKLNKLPCQVILSKLKEVPGFDTPVILLSNNIDNQSYITLGFSDIKKRNISVRELEKIIDRI